MLNLAKLLIFLAMPFFIADAAPAQTPGAPRIYEVEFKKGVFVSDGAVMPHRRCPPSVPQGVCGNGNSKSYSIDGRAGDRILIELSSDTGDAVFSIFGPKGEVLEAGSATKRWSGKLPSDGYYRINVYTVRSRTPFNIRFRRGR